MNAFPTNRLSFTIQRTGTKPIPGGTHKSVPYPHVERYTVNSLKHNIADQADKHITQL